MAAKKPRFVVGIDLGTTHSAVAFSPVGKVQIEIFDVPQLVAPGEAAGLELLPSAVYLPAAGELSEGATRLPWGDEPSWIVGDLARRQGARVPGRMVSSAKSWLSHGGVDRTAAILPWGAPEGVEKISPVEGSARILAHVRSAWDAAHPQARLADQEVVLTVPASFDEVARELTVQAARQAGLQRFRLLEEPQAAFYDFLQQHEESLDAAIGQARMALVVDVGGGTTDLTLVRVATQPSGPPRIERVAVGDHLMLGGDNMDVTLARFVEAQLGGARLDASQWSALVQASRRAKELLLSPNAPQETSVALLGRGSRLVGGAQSIVVDRARAEEILLDGFLPRSRPDEIPGRKGRMGLTELGLPYAADPAISRHIAAFLRRHVQAAAETGVPIFDGLPRPDALLLNGGVFNAEAVRSRLSEVLAGWYGGEPVPLFTHGSLDLAVARGAAYYGLVRRGFGVRIGGGSPRAYYVGIEGEGGRQQALCVVPRGMEEGTEVEGNRIFRLVVGRPVTFPLYTSTSDRHDGLGELVAVDDELDALPPLHTILRTDETQAAQRQGEAAPLPVRIGSALTEIGTLELSLRTSEPPARRFRLEFSLRGEKAGGGAAVVPIDQLPARFDEARAAVELCYGKKAQPVEAREVKNLWRNLEKIIGDRNLWSSAVNREIWGIVMGGAQKRRRTADHERVWFQLAGFCLRPGFGAPLDDWRVSELWKVWQQGVQYTTEKSNWSEWWIMWRRVSGGLPAGHQKQILDFIRPWLKPPEGRFPPKPRGPKAEGFDEMLRLAASLERSPAAEKAEVGRWALHRLEGTAKSWWPLGRLGARQPFAGSAHDVVSRDVAENWLGKLLSLDWKKAEGAAFAATWIARLTGDRERDLPEEIRQEVARRLELSGSPEAWVQMVREGGEISTQDEMRVFGDTLPRGLRL